jgi:hypothetical protein
MHGHCDDRVQRKSIKAFSDTLLDFMSEDPEVASQITDAHSGGLQVSPLASLSANFAGRWTER